MFDFVSAGFCRGNSVGSEQQRRAAMICEGCSVKFTVFKRRRQCSVCQRYYCSHCLPLGQNSNSNTSTSVLARFTDKKLKCSKCEVLTARPLCRSQLRQLRVKDLQHYLTLQQVSTRGCVEKDDLVNLLIRHAGNSSNNTQKYDPVGDHTSYTNIQYGNRPSTVQHQPQHYQQQQEQREQHSFPSAPYSTHCFPSTSESSHNNDCLGSSVSNERTTATTSGESNTGNNSGCQNETSASDTSASQESTCHISTSSSSSSTDSNREWLGQSSAAAIDIVELTDSVDDLSSSESGPEPVITIIEDDTFERVATEVRRMSLSDEPIDPADSVSSAPEESATPHVTELEAMEVDEGSSVEITDINMDSSNDQNVSPDEIVLDDTSDGAATDPVITTQACTGITLASISSLEDLEKLTVKQLKELLSLNRVDYRGCCEKPELVERVARLWQEDSQTRKGLENMSMDELCKICMDAPVECVMLECGHMATCTACGKQLSECPICRQFVVRVVRTFRA